MPTIIGPTRRPTNITYQDPGSIHDDATARRLGLRGGTIAASTHLDQFPPMLVAAFGERWWTTGCLSLYFRHATTDGEPVIVEVDEPQHASLSTDADCLTTTRLVTPETVLVAEGTASVGTPSRNSELSARDLRHDPNDLRILGRISQGLAIGPHHVTMESSRQRARVEDGLITEPLDDYIVEHGTAALSTVVDALTHAAATTLLPQIGTAVGLWGAIEIRFTTGPVRLDTDYVATGSVAALGSSPKTEVLWYDMSLHAVDGPASAPVATMRILTRFMKASSPLYAEP
jgi:hypothetical protein